MDARKAATIAIAGATVGGTLVAVGLVPRRYMKQITIVWAVATLYLAIARS